MRFRPAVAFVLMLADAAGADGICANPTPWPEGGGPVLFQGIDTVRPALRNAGEVQAAEPIGLEPDVLQTGEVALAGLAFGTLTVEGPAICIRYRPEWLGLTLSNRGVDPVRGRVLIDTDAGGIDAILPEIAGGMTAKILLRASQPIVGFSATAFRLISAE